MPRALQTYPDGVPFISTPLADSSNSDHHCSVFRRSRQSKGIEDAPNWLAYLIGRLYAVPARDSPADDGDEDACERKGVEP